LTVGKAPDSGIVLQGDPTISGVHAVIERYGDYWAIRDMGSRNGTFVNGERIWGERRLRAGDEVLVGRTRMTYSADGQALPGLTETAQPPPDLTRREREVLVLLCQPLGSGDIFTEPATTKQIAKKLVVTEAAVKQHLASLYDKFGIHESGERRRVRLANEAIRRGAVSAADLKSARL
jgi:DNA-binding CsgD family transcriptional regulator